MSVSAVIPIRFLDVCHEDGSPKVFLGSEPLWGHTINTALQAHSLDRVFIAADDERFYDHLRAYPRLEFPFSRPSKLSSSGVTTLDVLAFMSQKLESQGYKPEYYMLLEVTHPIRPKGIIDQLTSVVSKTAFDSVFSAHVGAYNYWYEREDGEFARVQVKSGHTRSPMYQEMIGLASLFRPDLLKTNDPYGKRVGIVPINRLEGMIDARDPDGIWLAEQYLKSRG